MITSNIHSLNATASVYAKPLLDLDKGVRVEIIHLLLNSIAEDKTTQDVKKHDLYSCFSGSWGEDLSTEEYCKELREGIGEPREVEAW